MGVGAASSQNASRDLEGELHRTSVRGGGGSITSCSPCVAPPPPPPWTRRAAVPSIDSLGRKEAQPPPPSPRPAPARRLPRGWSSYRFQCKVALKRGAGWIWRSSSSGGEPLNRISTGEKKQVRVVLGLHWTLGQSRRSRLRGG